METLIKLLKRNQIEYKLHFDDTITVDDLNIQYEDGYIVEVISSDLTIYCKTLFVENDELIGRTRNEIVFIKQISN